MAANFEKQLATFIQDLSGGDMKLSDTQINEIVKFLATSQNYVALYGSMLNVEIGKDGSKTIIKDVKQTVMRKKATGTIGQSTAAQKAKLEPITVAWSKESNVADPIGLTNKDAALGWEKVAAEKLAGIIYDAFKAYQRTFYRELVAATAAEIQAGGYKNIQVIKLPYPIDSDAKARYVWNMINLATEALVSSIDDDQHIDKVEPDWTFMDARSHLITSLAQLGFASDKGSVAIQGGNFMTTKIADAVNVRECPFIIDIPKYLNNFDVAAIQTVKFKAKFNYQVIKSRVSEFDHSGDQKTYFEDLYGKDVQRNKEDSPTIVYKGLINLFLFDPNLDITVAQPLASGGAPAILAATPNWATWKGNVSTLSPANKASLKAVFKASGKLDTDLDTDAKLQTLVDARP